MTVASEGLQDPNSVQYQNVVHVFYRSLVEHCSFCCTPPATPDEE